MNTYKNKGEGLDFIKNKKKKKKKRRVKKDGARFAIVIFYAGIIAFIVAVMIGVSALKKEVTSYLADYEANQPQYTVESIFYEYFAQPDFNKLIEMTEYTETEFAKKEDIVSYLENKTAGKTIEYIYVAGSNKSKINVKADGEKFASYTVETENELSEHGFERYKLGQVKLFYKAEEYVNMTVPFNCTVYVNGKELSDEYITEKDITDDNRDIIPDGTYKFTYKKYSASGLMSEPQVIIRDRNGDTVAADYDGETKTYSYKFKYDESMREVHEAYVLEGMKMYARRIQNDASFSECKPYFEPGTDVYERIRKNPASFVWDHDGYSFADEWTGEYYMYSDGVFRCHVKFNHILHKKGKPDHPDPVDLILYLRVGEDGVYRIYDMETAS